MLRRTGAVALIAGVLVAGSTVPATADTPPATTNTPSFLSDIECGSAGGAGCSIILRWLSENGGAPATGGGGDTGGGDGTAGNGEWDHVDWDAIDWDSMDWSTVDWDAIDWDAIDYGEGTGGEGGTGTDAYNLLMETMASFELPPPEIATSPGLESTALVHTPIWLWLESESWEPTAATAELPGLSAELSAVPTQVRWTLGDGTETVCEGPGTPYDVALHDPAAESPDCGHVYTRSSLDQPEGAFMVTAEVNWDLELDFSTGDSNALGPMMTTAEVPLTVEESQGLVTGTGRQ